MLRECLPEVRPLAEYHVRCEPLSTVLQHFPQRWPHRKSKAILKLKFKKHSGFLHTVLQKKKNPHDSDEQPGWKTVALGPKGQCKEGVLEPGRPVFRSLTGGVALGKLHGHCASVSPSVKWAV